MLPLARLSRCHSAVAFAVSLVTAFDVPWLLPAKKREKKTRPDVARSRDPNSHVQSGLCIYCYAAFFAHSYQIRGINDKTG